MLVKAYTWFDYLYQFVFGTYIYMYLLISTYTHIYIYISVLSHTYLHVSTYTYVSTCQYLHICIYISVLTHMYLHISTYTCIYISVLTHDIFTHFITYTWFRRFWSVGFSLSLNISKAHLTHWSCTKYSNFKLSVMKSFYCWEHGRDVCSMLYTVVCYTL